MLAFCNANLSSEAHTCTFLFSLSFSLRPFLLFSALSQEAVFARVP